MTQIIKLEEINDDILRKIGIELRNGKLIVFPTETVYGIGANSLDKKAVSNIFKAKGRASDNPLIVHVSGIKMLKDIVYDVGDIEKKLIQAFWPGPLTIIMKKKEVIPDNVSSGLNTIGVRMPDNIIAKKLIEYAKVPIAAPSANKSGKPSGTSTQDIIKELSGKVDYIIDSGNTEIGIESTVIQVIDDKVRILRPGKITKEEIEKYVDVVEIDKHVLNPYEGKEEVLSPGMKYTHYAPETKCILVYSKDNKKLIDKINDMCKDRNVLVLARTGNLDKFIAKYKLGMGDTLEEIAHNMFNRLRQVDEYKVDLVIIEGVENKNLGLAIMNRFVRACGYRYIEI